MERWKPVEEDTRYSVSSLGRVRGVKGSIIRGWVTVQGYRYVDIGKGNPRSVHALVMKAFVGPYPAEHEIDHGDGNKLNNKLSNLEYVTHQENIRRAVSKGRWVTPNNTGSRNPQAKLTEANVRKIRKLGRNHTQDSIAELFGVSRRTISLILQGKTWRSV